MLAQHYLGQNSTEPIAPTDSPVDDSLPISEPTEGDVDTGGEGYDDFSPDRHPTPDNMWDFTDIECDTICATYSLVATIGLFMHLMMMAGPLEGWAKGNIILISNTLMTLVQYFNSVALMVGPQWYFDLQSWKRTTAFILALISFAGFTSAVIGEMTRMNGDDSFGETNNEMFMLYMLVMDIPEAFLSLGTLVLAMMSGEFSPSGDMNPHADDYEREDEKEVPELIPNHGHLPETSEEITYPNGDGPDDVVDTADTTDADADVDVDVDADVNVDADAAPVDV